MNSESTDDSTESVGFEIIPAVSILHGQPVMMKNREYMTLKDENGKERDIAEIIDELKKKYEKVLVTDLNGITWDRPQLEVLRRICSKMNFLVDAGSRYGEGAIDILITEAENVVLATKTLKRFEELENAMELSENIILGIDYDDGVLSPNREIRDMTPGALAHRAENTGIHTFILSDMKNLTSDTRFNIDVARTILSPERTVYVHGRFDSDANEIRTAGFAGAIIEYENLP